MSRGINFRLWCFHRMLLTHIIIFIAAVLLRVGAQDVLSMSHEIKARIEQPEVSQPQRPVITSISKRLRVISGSTIILPCKVENLGSHVLVWRRGRTHLLFSGDLRVDTDKSISLLEGSSLRISRLTPKHAGTYVCQVFASPPMELEHFLEVLVPPKITQRPADGQLVVKKDDPATLECQAEGYPVPVITWRTVGGRLPGGVPEKQGNILSIPSVDTYHSGEYYCTADNEVQTPDTARFKVKVLYSPEVKVDPAWVHAGFDSTVQFSCAVSAEPAAVIQWTHSDGSALKENEYVSIQNSGSSSKVKIRRITEDHLGAYTCTAANFLGSSHRIVEVSGLAEPANFRSNSTGEDDTSFLLLWSVKSYSPVIEYMLRVRRRKEDGVEEQQREWTRVMIPIDIQQSVFHSHSYNVTGLEPATAYEAIIQARNDFGWNHPSDTFIFYTYGRGQLQEVMEEQAFEPTTLLHPATNRQVDEEENKENIKDMESTTDGAVWHKSIQETILIIICCIFFLFTFWDL